MKTDKQKSERSVYRLFSWASTLFGVYDYDAADDGPEVEIITRILASHPGLVIGGHQ